MEYNILIVDDSALTRAAIKRIIDMIDVPVKELFEACNGAEALGVLEANSIDLVLADLNMPEMNGIELVEHMKGNESSSNIPVIVISTESSVTRIKDLLEKGIADFLHKPFTPEEFRTIISKNLEVS